MVDEARSTTRGFTPADKGTAIGSATRTSSLSSSLPTGAGPDLGEDTSDGYHTFRELYEYRKAYNALLFNQWAALGLYNVHKSWRHSDGEPCFSGGWFIVVAQMPSGQISNHYKTDEWALFNIPERERGAEWDGHTPQVALSRLLSQAAAPVPLPDAAPSPWREIQTYPKDEAPQALLYGMRDFSDGIVQGCWNRGDMMVMEHWMGGIRRPTHWMPTPDPPSSASPAPKEHE